MRLSKTEVNFRRLLAAAPRQKNQAKLIHYVSTLREQLEELSCEKTPEGLPRISKSVLNEFSEKVDALASKLATASPSEQTEVQKSEDSLPGSSLKGSSRFEEGADKPLSPGLRRRHVSAFNAEDRTREDGGEPVKLDSAAQEHIEKHRKLQDVLTDEMVGLARQLKEGSLLVSQSLKNTGKILDSTEQAIENSLASTGHANSRSLEVSSASFKTTCFTWLALFGMTCIFIMVVLLIRIT